MQCVTFRIEQCLSFILSENMDNKQFITIVLAISPLINIKLLPIREIK